MGGYKDESRGDNPGVKSVMLKCTWVRIPLARWLKWTAVHFNIHIELIRAAMPQTVC